MQTVGAEREAISGDPDAIEEVAQAQIVDAEPDLKLGELGDPHANAPAYLEGAETESFVDIEDHWSLREGIAGENARVEEDRAPHVELQEPGVGHLATLEEGEFLTWPPLSPPITPEAARTQHSPAVNAGMPATPDPEGSTNLVPPLPDEGAEPRPLAQADPSPH